MPRTTPKPRSSSMSGKFSDDALGPLSDMATGRRLQRLSRFMDSAIKLPGGYRIGWDGIIGLIPGIGDVAGLGVSAYIVFGAARLGASKATLARMAGNLGVEALIGVVPLIGNVFDFVFKANERNMRLLERHMREPEQLRRRSRGWLIGFAALGIALVLLVGWLMVTLLVGLFGLIF